MADLDDSFQCPVCGADVPLGRLSCPECGADERTGWKEEEAGAALNLPDEDEFNYDEFLRNEGFTREGLQPEGVRKGWWIIAIILLLALVIWVLRG